MITLLAKNIKKACDSKNISFSLEKLWDTLLLEVSDNDQENFSSLLKNLPGIESFASYTVFETTDMKTLGKQMTPYFSYLEGKQFVVRVKRSGEHSFSSLELERYLGGVILQNIKNTSVNVHTPEEIVRVKIKNTKTYLLSKHTEGKKGFPVGSQGKVLSLLSGGFDSAVSSYLMMKKGCTVDFLFCNLGGDEHLKTVKTVANHLYDTFMPGHHCHFLEIDFYEILNHLHKITPPKYQGILLKRVMIAYAAEYFAKKYGYQAIVTGESMGQVSSQTLSNLNTIHTRTDTPLFLPLLTFTKQEILDIAEDIMTFDLTKHSVEYCKTTPEKPATLSSYENIALFENNLDTALISEICENTCSQKFPLSFETHSLFPSVSSPQENDIIVDLRTEKERKNIPLSPLLKSFPCSETELTVQLENKKFLKNTRYLLYCHEGTLSTTLAHRYAKQGFTNIGVYLPSSSCSLL
jgi:thiamine biosynthesis protein ThiI